MPLTSDRAEVPAADDAGHGTSGVYRPRYELVAEEILQLIDELPLRPGDRMPTEKELAAGNKCPVHDRPVDRVKEKSLYFKLSALEKRLFEHYGRSYTPHPEGILILRRFVLVERR